jgi:Ras-related protein Rab-7A
VILLGDAGVGKTTIISKYTGKPVNEKATVGAEIFVKQTEIDKKPANFNFWDTAGQEKFDSLGVAFFRGCNACVLVYDVTNRKSFD